MVPINLSDVSEIVVSFPLRYDIHPISQNMIIILACMQCHQFAEHGVAQVHHNFFTHPAYRKGAHKRGDTPYQKDQQDNKGYQPDYVFIPV
jgi:hypothetical protein